MMGGTLPFGAEQRLLPEWIPLSFFSFALICLPLGWLLLFIQADNIASFSGGFGPVLACLHMFSIGVVLSTAFGASMQMLPVATGAAMNKPHGVVILLGLLIIGTTIMLGGFAHYFTQISTFGSLFLLGAVLLYGAMLVRLLLRSETLKIVRNHVFIGALCLILAATFGTLMILDWAEHLSFGMANGPLMHAGLALYGFMGLIVLGFSRIMIPMLAVSDTTNDKLCHITLMLSFIALALWISGQYQLAPIVATVASCLYVFEMVHILKGRMRTRLGPEWLPIRFSWVMFPTSLLLACAALWSDRYDYIVQLCIIIALLGWLVSFIIGILQRIIPFLLSMQIARRTGMPELPSKLAHEKLLSFIGPAHILAVVLTVTALIFEQTLLLRFASLIGIMSGILFLIFLITALKRKRHCLEKMTS
ncbi:conserved membrane hypothetical protein [Candidatus Terasakiella magnetica]|uniref:Uncharacterized protein n=1 Tax=Candidatus Terasakiella magnetica TaxID=1867952 RepID=A0A1C3RE06_9PROT|nr:hypothetical protein [Candidatus Terasakiella magnetica]SCA55530.1 conserved membrane hypothetical protein [Candidatus Terasakiella magnetica]